MKSERLKADLSLITAAVLWGGSFVVQAVAVDALGVFLFNGLCFLLGGLVLLPLIRGKFDRKVVLWGLLGGVALFGASVLEQAGLRSTTAGNAAFISQLYVIIVPFIMVFLFKQRLIWTSWLAAITATIGVALLSGNGQLHLAYGDLLEVGGAFLWSAHFIIVDRAMKDVDLIQFSVCQYFVCGIFNLELGLIFEGSLLIGLTTAWWTVLYVGVLSIAASFTLQSYGQKHTQPADATLLISLEGVFGAFFGYLFINEKLTGIQLFGCGLIMAAILFNQFFGKLVPSKIREEPH
jgi:drug/metabolite transporter (DMT)-like permease